MPPKLRRVLGRTVRAATWCLMLPLLAAAAVLGRVLTAWRLHRCRPRSLWGITPILTLRPKSRSDRLLGFRADSVVFQTYHISHDFDVNLEPQSRFLLKWMPVLHPALECLFLCRALLRYDVFHLFYDRGILGPYGMRGIRQGELLLLAWAGKRLYTYAYGADVRTRERTLALGQYNFCIDCPDIGRYCVCDDAMGRDTMARIARYANAMTAMGDMRAYVPNVRPLYHWPLDLDRIPYVGVSWTGDRPLRIVHAPNHPHFKGTRYLVDAVARLQQEGFAIEFQLVQKMSNEEARRKYAEADLVAEQFIGGFHGYTALEAMAAGKPVITYLRSRDLVPSPDECPLISSTPDTLYDIIRHCAGNPGELRALGEQGRRYVERHCSIPAFAAQLGEMYLETGRFPARLQADIRAAVDALARPDPSTQRN